MTTKKSVDAKQLFGPKTPARKVTRCYAEYDVCHPSSRDIHCALKSQTYSQSNDVTGHGSYTMIPTPPATTSTMAYSNPRFYTGHCYRESAQHYPANNSGYCYYNVGPSVTNRCTCDNNYRQYAAHPPPPPPATFTMTNDSRKQYENGCYSGYELGNRLTDEEDSAFPGLLDREFYMLHHNVPALRRSGVDTTTIRQHFYPDGGWGWIICSASFLVHILSSGLQLSYGLLLFYAIQHLKLSSEIEWLGALSWAISLMVTPFVVTFCRKKSTRLLAVVGGLVLSLGILFTSFATEFGQILFSYGIIFGVGVAMVRESSSIILGNYFKKRRQFVEMVAMSGEGVGIALFSVILKEGVGKVGWRLGLQIVAALVSINFFMGLLYRPASLYHPQRRAIQHLKNQRKKVREKKMPTASAANSPTKTYILDFSPLKSSTVKLILITSSVASLGIYTPMFSMSINAAKEGSDIQDLVLLQTFLGMSTALGVVLAGTILRRPLRIRNTLVSTHVISQVFISTVAVAILFLSFVMGYRGLCILSWIYGIGFGGFRYSIKILALERVKVKHFAKAWGLIKGAESIPVLISVPLTSFLNDYSLKYGRAGYYICSAAAAIAAITIFFIGYNQTQVPNRNIANGRISTMRTPAQHYKAPVPAYFPNGWKYSTPDLIHSSCVSLNQMESDPTVRNVHCGRSRATMRARHYNNPCQHADRRDELRCGTLSRQTSQYHFGQGSIGAQMGKRLQKSLSFIHKNEELAQCSCSRNFRQPIVCTCSPNTLYNQCAKSRSVPEGLSFISQQCICADMGRREAIYMPRTPPQPRGFDCAHCPTDRGTNSLRYHRQRSQSLSKPFQYVEQITTSV